MALKKCFFTILLVIISAFNLMAQLPDNKIIWSRERPLEWKDFQGKPNPDNPYHANTNSGVSYGWTYRASKDEVEFDYTVFAFFLPGNSWVKTGRGSDNLLAHEQLHFDITELHARKLRKVLQDFDPKAVRDVKSALQKIYDKIEAERKAMQEQFDRETNHSQNELKQQQWLEKVNNELKKLQEFSQT